MHVAWFERVWGYRFVGRQNDMFNRWAEFRRYNFLTRFELARSLTKFASYETRYSYGERYLKDKRFKRFG